MFSNWKPTTANWIAGAFGVSGFSINCIAKFDKASVQLYLGKPEKSENKKVFDYLYDKKQIIETSFGDKLIWNRNPENIASNITYELPGVSISNETDWTQMAKFNAEQSKKLY